jgi:hypothetical protein
MAIFSPFALKRPKNFRLIAAPAQKIAGVPGNNEEKITG